MGMRPWHLRDAGCGIAVAAKAAACSRSMAVLHPRQVRGSVPAHPQQEGAQEGTQQRVLYPQQERGLLSTSTAKQWPVFLPTSERLRSSSMMALVGLISSVFLLLMYAAMLLSRRACGTGGGRAERCGRCG